jgi:hypothetical protein
VLREIAAGTGVATSTVHDWQRDPDGSLLKARKLEHTGAHCLRWAQRGGDLAYACSLIAGQQFNYGGADAPRDFCPGERRHDV